LKAKKSSKAKVKAPAKNVAKAKPAARPNYNPLVTITHLRGTAKELGIKNSQTGQELAGPCHPGCSRPYDLLLPHPQLRTDGRPIPTQLPARDSSAGLGVVSKKVVHSSQP
jgi:hypothetical protein